MIGILSVLGAAGSIAYVNSPAMAYSLYLSYYSVY
jgi:hypothetical protein